MTIQLRPYQQEAHDAIIQWFHDNPTGQPLCSIPTGGGKSLVIAKLCETILSYPDQRIIIVTHSRELVEQDFNAMKIVNPKILAGIYCSGLNKKDHAQPIIFASIQSIHNKAIKFGWRDIIICDECHRISDSDEGMYRRFMKDIWGINQKARLIGFSATIFRTKTGMLHEGENSIFNAVAYEVPLLRLIQEGWLCPPIGKHSKVQANTDNIGHRGGEFILFEAQDEFDREELTKAAIEEMLRHGADRKTWLIFYVSVQHSEHVAKALTNVGIECKSISEKTPSAERKQIIENLRSGKLRAVSNVEVATTGLDIKNIDMVVFLRPTESPGLYIQMAGRALRLSPETGKINALLLDFAGNGRRLGPLTHVVVSHGEKRKTEDEERSKICPNCESIMAPHLMECLDCGYEFPPQPRVVKHSKEADYYNPISDMPILAKDGDSGWFTVDNISYEKHFKATMDGPPSLCVKYSCGHMVFKEWISIENPRARHFAVKWWLEHSDAECPLTVDDAIDKCHNGYLDKVAAKILVKKEGKYPRIISRQMVDRWEWQHRERTQPVVAEEPVEESFMF